MWSIAHFLMSVSVIRKCVFAYPGEHICDRCAPSVPCSPQARHDQHPRHVRSQLRALMYAPPPPHSAHVPVASVAQILRNLSPEGGGAVYAQQHELSLLLKLHLQKELRSTHGGMSPCIR